MNRLEQVLNLHEDFKRALFEKDPEISIPFPYRLDVHDFEVRFNEESIYIPSNERRYLSKKILGYEIPPEEELQESCTKMDEEDEEEEDDELFLITGPKGLEKGFLFKLLCCC